MKKIDLTQGKVSEVLTALALPIMGSSLLQFTYNLVDMLWVGGLGSDAVASVGSSSFYIGLGYAINALVVIGTGIKVSHALGQKDEEAVKRYVHSGMLLNLIIAVLFTAFLLFGGKGLIAFINLKDTTLQEQAYGYLSVSSLMMFFAFFNLLYIRIFGSFGNNKIALKISAIGIILNIILDPMFIYLFKLGVMGAALATLISNIVMFVLFHIQAKGLFVFKFKSMVDKEKVLEIARLGLPMASQRILFTLINILLARLIGSFGSDAIAAQKIGLQIESVTFMVIGGLNGAIASFTGQNFGAKKYKRIQEGYRVALKVGIIYSVVNMLVFIAILEMLAMLFVRDEMTIAIASDYLRIVAFSQIFSTVEMVSNGLFTGIGKPKIPATISMIFTALRIPFALILTPMFGVSGVWISIALSSILKGISAYIVYKFKVGKEYENAE